MENISKLFIQASQQRRTFPIYGLCRAFMVLTFLAVRPVALSGGSELWPWAGFEAAGTRLAFTSSLGLAVAPSVFRASVPIYCPNWEKPQKRAFFLSPPEWILVPQPLRDTSHKVPPMT